jgi:hypothetical protein
MIIYKIKNILIKNEDNKDNEDNKIENYER